jgi:hypothetical protein
MLNQTPREQIVDAVGRPCFLWDLEMTLPEFEEALCTSDPAAKGYLLAKLMRQAKPDDVFLFVGLDIIFHQWNVIAPHLGNKAAFWRWALHRWGYDVE